MIVDFATVPPLLVDDKANLFKEVPQPESPIVAIVESTQVWVSDVSKICFETNFYHLNKVSKGAKIRN